MVQVRKFAPHLHHTMKSFAILHNFIDNYNILIIFAIYPQTTKYQCIYKRYKIAIFEYCPGHTEIKSQSIINQLRFFICHCAATASPSPMAGKRVSACDRNKRISTNLSKGGGYAVACDRFQIRAYVPPPLVQQSSARYANDPQAGKRPAIRPQYFDAKSIKPEKFRRTGKFRVGKNRGKGIFQQSEGPENLYNIRNCSYTKYLLSNICK